MGCDIHAIVEIKRNNKWEYIPELPSFLSDRNYGVFSILNRNIRRYSGCDGFEAKGLPLDVSGRKFRFASHKEYVEKTFFGKSAFVCYIGGEGQKYLSPFDESLKTEIDFELYEELKSGMTEEQSLRYYSPTQSMQAPKYFVQDAQKVNGEFRHVPFSALFSDIKEFNAAFTNVPWHDAEEDFGYYDVDFDSDLHGMSHLNLAELKSKLFNNKSDKTFLVDNEFLLCLQEELGDELPETLLIGDVVNGQTEVSFVEDPYKACAQAIYNDGVQELCKIKEKYGIEKDDDIRIVFAFDS